MGRVQTVARLCELYPLIFLQLRKKHGKTSVSVKMYKYIPKTEYCLINISLCERCINNVVSISHHPFPENMALPAPQHMSLH